MRCQHCGLTLADHYDLYGRWVDCETAEARYPLVGLAVDTAINPAIAEPPEPRWSNRPWAEWLRIWTV